MAQDRNQNAALSVGASQLSIPEGAVRQPDTQGAAAQMEYSDRLVGQLSQFGGVVSEQKMKNQADQMRANAAVMVNQGRALKDIHNSDKGAGLRVFGETATMQGAHAQYALVQMDEMARALREEVDQRNGDQMTPGQYREYANARYAEALAVIPEGSSGRDIVAQMGQKVLAQGAAYQAEKHYAYTQKAELSAYTAQAFSILQEAQSAKEAGEETLYKQAMADLVVRLQKPDNMDEDAHAGVMTAIVNDSLRFGDPAVMDIVLEMNPMLSPEQRASIDHSHETYLQREAEKGSMQQAMDLAQIESMAANGAGYHAVSSAMEVYNAKYQRTPLTVGKMESLFSLSTQAAVARQQKAEAAQARTDALVGQYDYILGDKEGKANLQQYMAANIGTPQYYQAWNVSFHHNPVLNHQLSAGLDPAHFLDAEGKPTQTALNAFTEMQKWESINPQKAKEMVPDETWQAYTTIKRMTANGTMGLGSTIERVGGAWNDRPKASTYNKEVKEMFAEEDFGLGKWTDAIGGADDSDFMEAQGLAAERYKEYRRIGLDPVAAQEEATKEVKQSYVRVGNTMVNSRGVSPTTFHTKDFDTLKLTTEQALHNDKALATRILGDSFGWDKKIVATSIVKTTMGPQVQFTVQGASGQQRILKVTPQQAIELQMAAKKQNSPAPTQDQFRDDPMQNTNTSYLPTD